LLFVYGNQSHCKNRGKTYPLLSPFMYLFTIYLDPYIPDDGLFPCYTRGESISRKSSIKDEKYFERCYFPNATPGTSMTFGDAVATFLDLGSAHDGGRSWQAMHRTPDIGMRVSI
jgi:hypothetical protein